MSSCRISGADGHPLRMARCRDGGKPRSAGMPQRIGRRRANRLRTRLMRACLIAVATVLSIAACAADVVRVDGAPSLTGPATSNEATTVCGLAGPVAVRGSLLSAADVWPGVANVGGVASDMPLDGVACRHAVATATAQPSDCDLGFPFYAPGALPADLARLGVRDIREV